MTIEPGPGLAFTVLGLLFYALLYIGHDRGGREDSLDVVSLPAPVRMLVRAGRGPARLNWVAAQIWSLGMATAGIVVALGYSAPSSLLTIGLIGGAFYLGVETAIALVARESQRSQDGRHER